jgi:hypothetical protein
MQIRLAQQFENASLCGLKRIVSRCGKSAFEWLSIYLGKLMFLEKQCAFKTKQVINKLLNHIIL